MITSLSNPKLHRIAHLQKSSRQRREEGVFIAEGPRMVSETPEGLLRELYLSESFYKKNPDFSKQLTLPGDAEAEILSDACMHKVSDTVHPQGVLAVVRQPKRTLEEIFGGGCRKRALSDSSQNDGAGDDPDVCPLLLALEDLQDAGNLGTILRTAEAAGVSGILLSRDCADPFSPKVVRSTMGALYRVPFFICEDFRKELLSLQKKSVVLFAADLAGSRPYDEPDYCSRPVCFVIGNEGRGLTAETALLCDDRIRIPMAGRTESLNAAVAAAVLMFEAARQRRGFCPEEDS